MALSKWFYVSVTRIGLFFQATFTARPDNGRKAAKAREASHSHGGRRRALTALALVSGPAVAGGDPVDAEARSFAIPAGPLSDCLHQIARVSDLQLIYSSFLTHGLYCKGLRGRMRWTVALDLVLSDTSYTWGIVNGRTITIGPPRCLPIFTKAEFGCGRPRPPAVNRRSWSGAQEVRR